MKAFFIFLFIIAITYYALAKVGLHLKHKSTMRGWSWPANLLIPIAAFAAMMLALNITIVPAQVCGVVITPSGVKQYSLKTGWHFIPFWYKVYEMDKTAQVYTCAKATPVSRSDENYKEYKASSTQSGTVWVPTRDGIKMGFDISASWAIDEDMAWWIYDNVSEQDGGKSGRFYWLEENVIKPKLKSALALSVSKYDPISVYSNKRLEIQDSTFTKMKNEIRGYHLKLAQIDIREIYYNEDYEVAINAKKLAEQEVLRLMEVTRQKDELEKQSLVEKRIAINKAEGEAEALKIKGGAIASNPKIIQLEWINRWDGKLPTMITDGKGIMLNMAVPQ